MKPRTPELKEPLSQVFRGVKREAGKPPFIHPKKTLSISTSGEESNELVIYLCSSFQVKVWVERPWDLKELQNVKADLLEPRKGNNVLYWGSNTLISLINPQVGSGLPFSVES